MDHDLSSLTKPTDVDPMSDVNIVHIVRQYSPMVGGLEDFVKNLVAEQKDRFASVRVVTLDRSFRDPESVLPASEVVDGIEVTRIPYSGSTRYPVAPSVFRQLSGADLVHVHAVDFFFDALALMKPFHRKKIVATTHGGFFHTKAHGRLKTIWFNTLTRFSASRYAQIACCSDSDLDLFRKIASRNSRLIENGVDLQKFAGGSAETPAKRMVTIGRFSDNKRLDRSLDVLKALVSDDPDWSLEIIGMPSDLSAEDVKRLASERGIAGQVHLHVGLSNSDILDVLRTCSIFVSASEYEGFGIALIEAMSAGLQPVVHPNTAFQSLARLHPEICLSDFAEANKTAALVRSAYADLSADKQKRLQLVEAVEGYGWKAAAAKYDQLYMDALGLK